MTAQVLAGALADDGRRRVFGAVVLGAADRAAVAARTGLTAREVVTALRRLADAGVVTGVDGDLRVDGDWLREAAAGPPAPDAGPVDAGERVLRTFLRDGVLVGLPAQRGRRRVLLAHIATSFEPGVRYPERAVDDTLRGWCAGGASDHVTLRRYLIDEALLSREQGVYWRTG
ncbi:DUF2087 domain-containing protein [Micromonospora endolithica]|uniref:DUF2087 domain-containing protein n=1 Tax=Micromonospora endolithica TaxID=230091 RepID=A0A3A9YZP3_9ACTN|nr:DUF2087 domain-containing protein [Micromonospora endolithica]RKN41551.1 DUF2087 domain-containing protein [Micromonospora endolithica]TWJ21869.1 hypothetical protein JD76_01983 [Micromonospora endolithica]